MKQKLLLLLLLIASFAAFAQKTISGEVIDEEDGGPIVGANVVVVGTNIGTSTDYDGIFKLTVDELPVSVEITFIGYQKQTIEINNTEPIKASMKTDATVIGDVEVVDTRITKKQQQAALTIESLDVLAIKEAPTGSFYESLGTLKGVDLTSASIGFKVINTRGFNSTSPVRSLQIINGVDNQAPGLNFSLGNFLGASDLDVKRVNIIAGASSAFYGPNAFNGVISMETKDPFTFPGLSVSLKAGERSLQEYAVRWAHVLKNSKGEEKFGYKLNLYYMGANDWVADNFNPVDGLDEGLDNPGGVDAVNVYGDEDTEVNNDFLTPLDNLENPGLGRFYRTGYREQDIVDYDTENGKIGVGLYYNFNSKLQLNYNLNYGTGTTVYQGDNRYSLNNIQFIQNIIELKNDKFFIRAYATNEDAGDSYDAVLTAIKIQEELGTRSGTIDWNTQYSNNWERDYVGRVRNLPGYPTYDPNVHGTLEEWANGPYNDFIEENKEIIQGFHNGNRDLTDTQIGPRPEPGTALFDSVFNYVTSRDFIQGGSRFYDKSALYHIHGEYKFTPSFGEIVVGANARLYKPDSRGTIFDEYRLVQRLDANGNPVFDSTQAEFVMDSVLIEIENFEYGAYAGIEKKFNGEQFKVNATLRMDKNENFDYLLSPALSLVYNANENNTFRFSFSSAIRNPTLQDQYLNFRVGRALLKGNLNGFDSLITFQSFDEYRNNSLDLNRLDYFNVDPVKPERVKTFEIGYRGMIKKKLFIDASYYYSIYDDFLGFNFGLQAEFDQATRFPVGDIQPIRVAANSKDQVTTQGVVFGANYYIDGTYAVNGNYSWNRLDLKGSDDPIIPAFNTPEHKFNIGFSGREIKIPKLKIKHLGFSINYKWIQGFLFEGSPQFTGSVPTYDLVDAQVNYFYPKLGTTFKLGASNLLNNKVFQVYGGPRVGRLAYFSILFELERIK